MKTLRWAFTAMAIIAIFGFIACGGDDGNGNDIKTVAQPTADPGAGSYAAEQSITLECATNEADIYYSLDGTTPSTPYSDPITISETTTLKAVAKKSGMNDSTVLTAGYTINIPPKTLTGNISISPTTAFTGEELTATYSGSEAVNYQWNKDGTPIGGKTTNKLTPTDAGSYTVTVSLAGYESKTSVAVAVSECECPEGTIHLVGETDCKSTSNCSCEHDVPGIRVQGIAVTNRSEFPDISGTVTNIEWALEQLPTYEYSADILKENVTEIAIVSGATVDYDLTTRIISVGLDATRGMMRNIFLSYLDEFGIISLQLDKSKRMANVHARVAATQFA